MIYMYNILIRILQHIIHLNNIIIFIFADYYRLIILMEGMKFLLIYIFLKSMFHLFIIRTMFHNIYPNIMLFQCYINFHKIILINNQLIHIYEFLNFYYIIFIHQKDNHHQHLYIMLYNLLNIKL